MPSRPIRAALLVLLLSSCLGASAQYPDKPVRWIVPYPAGGGSDAIARVVTDAMQRRLNQPIVVDNRPGAATNIAVSAMLQSTPDGYTVMQAENAALASNEHLFSKLPYKPDVDFRYIGAIGRLPVALVVRSTLAVNTLAAFIDYVKAHPDEASYASPGMGTPHHLAMEQFKQQTGLPLALVTYKGGVPALQDVIGGHVTAMMIDLGTGRQAIRSGKLRVLAIASRHRVESLPDVPTFAELGLSDVNVFAFQGLVGPAAMPDDTVAVLHAAMAEALQEPKVAAFLGDLGLEPVRVTPAEFRSLARAESARGGAIIRSLGLRLD